VHESVSDVIRAFSRFGLYSTACEVAQTRPPRIRTNEQKTLRQGARVVRDQLVTAIAAAQKMFRDADVEPSSHMRLYDGPRAFASVVVDDSVAYTPLRFAGNGRSAPLTKSGFAVINGGSSMGP
jgi:hypothetical protein